MKIIMTGRTFLGLVLVVTLGSARAFAEEPPARVDPSPVRAGKTTVTVIDENESVDDVVTRVRAERSRQGQADRRSGDQPALPRAAAPAPGDRPAARPGPAGAAVRRALRDARAAGEPRPAQAVRERIRERVSERKPVRPRAEQVPRRQRNR
jgi:hypothetical protein